VLLGVGAIHGNRDLPLALCEHANGIPVGNQQILSSPGFVESFRLILAAAIQKFGRVHVELDLCLFQAAKLNSGGAV